MNDLKKTKKRRSFWFSRERKLSKKAKYYLKNSSSLTNKYYEYDWNTEPNLIPEQLLLLEILRMAIKDARGLGYKHNMNLKQENHLQQKAREWLVSQNKEPFTFLWILDHLPYDTEDMQTKILAMVGLEKPLDSFISPKSSNE